MSQEYTEDKEVSLIPMSSGRRLLEALLLLVSLFAVYLMVSLISFNPSDPSWSQTAWHEPIHNLGGGLGAWLADTLLFIFGVMAYAIPIIIFGLCWITYKYQNIGQYLDYFAIGLRLIGVLALVTTTCGLAAINADDIWYFASGGVIGSLISTAIQPWFSPVGGTLTLLFIWAAGLTLYTGWSWLTIAEKIGAVVMSLLTFASHQGRDQDYWRAEKTAIEREDDAHEDVTTTEPAQFSIIRRIGRPLFRRRMPAYDYLAPQKADDDPLFSSPDYLEEPGQADPFDPLLSSRQPITSPKTGQLTSDITPVAAPSSSAKFTPTGVQTSVTFQQSEPTTTSEVEAKPEQEGIAAATIPTVQSSTYYVQQTAVASTLVEPTTLQPATAEFSPSSDEHPELVSQQATPQDKSQSTQTADYSWYTDPKATTASDSESLAEPTMSGVQPTSVKAQSPFAMAAGMGKLNTNNSVHQRHSRVDTENPQVKQGIGPELPRPKPIRIPTRRELSSYGIKLPSHEAELKARQQQVGLATEDESEQSQADLQQQAELSAQFQRQQSERYGQGVAASQPTILSEEEESTLQQAELAREFTAQQQQRYGAELLKRESEAVPVSDSSSDVAVSSNLSLENWQAVSGSHDVANRGHNPKEEAYHASSESDFINSTDKSASSSMPLNADIVPPTHATAGGSTIASVNQTNASESEVSISKMHDSLFHPFLVRHEQPLEKPTTPLPTLDLLTEPPSEEAPIDMFALEQTGQLVETRLNDFRVKAEVVGISPGPVITRFELDLAPGVKAARISSLSRDLARSLSAVAVRVVEVIPGKPYVGLELPNQHRQTVYLREVLDCPAFRDDPSPLTVVLGKDISGEPVVADLAKMPHLLVAGTTGSGKSVGVNAMILSMLYKATPDEVRFIMIDPKMLELSIYEGIPHLLTEVVTDMKDAANALRWCVGEMERRYKLMSALGVRNLAGYNAKMDAAEQMGRPVPDPFWKPGDSMDTTPPVLERLPYIVVMVDEFADLMMAVGKKVEELIARLAQKARAAGIHLVLATQRPSVDVITGLIKANIPTRIAFTVSSKIDSRTILDQGGAESLLGMGDMLYVPPNSSMPIRVHGAFVRDQEVHAVVQDWKARGRPQYIDSITAGDELEAGGAERSGEDLDPLFDQAVAFVIEKRRASISGVQRQFRIGYNRAARIVEQMEAQGIVSEPGHNGNREVLSPPPHER